MKAGHGKFRFIIFPQFIKKISWK